MLYLRPTHLQTTNIRSNAYWLQHHVQHHRTKYAVKVFRIHIRKGVQRNLHLEQTADIQSLQMKTKRIIQQFKLPSCNSHLNRYFYFMTLLPAG